MTAQTWKKEGLVFQPDGQSFWQQSHAALPTHLHLGGNVYRVYFTSRDKKNRAYVGFYEFDITRPCEILRVSDEPVLSPGPLGCFDDHGVQATSVVANDDRDFMYYLGWNPCRTEPLFYASIGLAISNDGGLTFEKYSAAPIMQRSEHDPWMVSGGTVRKEADAWRMWYLSGTHFEMNDGVAKSFYDIKIAESDNGIDWRREGVVALGLNDGETNISRVSIVEEGGRYRAWYPIKRDGCEYRIGYAESNAGVQWERKDHFAGIDVSESGWDSEALDKCEVFQHEEKLYMLYNGNRFGFDGIGLAVSDAW